MTYADDRELRREVYTAYVTRASDQGPSAGQWDNLPLIQEMLALRYQLAQILGFDNYVEYALARRMAEKPADILAFLEGWRGRPARRRNDSTRPCWNLPPARERSFRLKPGMYRIGPSDTGKPSCTCPTKNLNPISR